jgi:sugar-specific transcriptional regulator TrmB
MDATYFLPAIEAAGLNHHEARVYIALLSEGQRSASELARQSRTPRSTIRSILDRLCEKGIVDKIYRGNVQHYSCLPTGALVRAMEREITERQERADKLRSTIHKLEALRTTGVHLPVVRYFEGEQGVMEALHHSLVNGSKEILFLTSYDFFQNERVRKYDIEQYLPDRLRRGIRMRVLGEKSKEATHWHQRSAKELREHRFLSKGKKLPGNFWIYGNYVLYFSANKGELIAVLTESAVMAATMKTMFEELWKHAEKE